MANHGSLPLLFEPTIDPALDVTRFVARTGRQAVAITTAGITFAVPAGANASAPGSAAPVTFDFIGASGSASIAGEDPRETRVHRLRSNAAEVQHTELPTYGRVRIADLQPGIDLVVYGSGRRVEYDVVVRPGGDPSSFGLQASGDAGLALDDAGDLLVSVDAGILRLHRPVAYQERDGQRVDVDSAFLIDGERTVRIHVGSYDPARTLIIDPVVSYATYLGGSSFEQGTAIAVDASGNAYVAGYTLSPDFPTVSPYDRSLGKAGDVDVFVSKLNAAGTALVWSTYLGGTGVIDRAVGIAVDAAGSAYVTGQTAGGNFPVSAGAWQKAVSSGGTFVTKLSPAGNALAYSTYVAGAASNAIALDREGNAYIAGSATSAFMTTTGALQRAPAGSTETGFVLKLNAAGSAPVYATFLGGAGQDRATAIAVDAQGNAYVGGWTTSNDFPLVNAFQAAHGGGRDAFVAKLDAAGSRLVYSTLLGGTLDDAVNAIAIDANGYAYLAGETYSSDFPSKGGFQSQKAGARLINSSVGNAFVAKLAPLGDALVYSSFLGGEVCTTLCELVFGPQPQFRADEAYGIAIDAAGHAFVSGIARSYTFPLVDSSATRKREDNEDSAFVTKVSASGNTLLWSTFLRTGAAESDNKWTRFPPGAATGIALHPSGAAYVTGDADSYSNFQPSAGAFQSTSSNFQGSVVVKFAAAPAMVLRSSSDRLDANTPVTLTATLAGPGVSGNVVFLDGSAAIGNAALAGNVATLSTTLPVGIHALTALLRIPGIAADTPVLYQIVDAPLACN
jgi:hypothetical protein